MQIKHVPQIDRRYWCAILFASIFGTNLGDFYAHESGLGIAAGVALLTILFAITFLVEQHDRAAHEFYYWLAIIIIRTGATNIADFLAFRIRIPGLLLASGLAGLIALLAWLMSAAKARRGRSKTAVTLTQTDLTYWAAMLAAGVFGTVVGDISSHHFGQGPSAIVLGALLATLLAGAGPRAATNMAAYWCIVAVARTAGTCMGDWLAESKTLHIGLPLSTLLTGAAFLAILAMWRSTRPDIAAPA